MTLWIVARKNTQADHPSQFADYGFIGLAAFPDFVRMLVVLPKHIANRRIHADGVGAILQDNAELAAQIAELLGEHHDIT